MTGCLYCEDGERLHNAMVLVKETKYSKIYLKMDQKHPGRCIVLFKEHKTELYKLTEEERNCFMSDVSNTAKAIAELYSADKMNYAIYGDLVPHLHFHIVPKRKDGLNWGMPFDDTVPQVVISEGEMSSEAKRIREKLDEVL